MDPIIASALISGGSKLIEGILGSSDAAQRSDVQMRTALLNLQQQREFAQAGIRWKANDARLAEKHYGINALVGMGVQPTTFSPVSVGDVEGNAMGKAIGGMGQDIARAVEAYKSPEEKAVEAANTKLDLERKQLSNYVLRAELGSKLARTASKTAGSPPGVVKDWLVPDPGGKPKYIGAPADAKHGVTIYDPFFGNVAMPPGPDAQTVQNEIGEGGELLTMFRYLNAWLRQNTGRELWTADDTRQFQKYVRPFISGR